MFNTRSGSIYVAIASDTTTDSDMALLPFDLPHIRTSYQFPNAPMSAAFRRLEASWTTPAEIGSRSRSRVTQTACRIGDEVVVGSFFIF